VDPVAGETGYTTIQSAMDAANAAGIAAAVFVRAGTYTEDLTFYDGIDVWAGIGVADTQTCKIVGKHTPPLSGTLTVRNIFLESATHIFDSNAAGTTEIILIDCALGVTNGYTFNLPNWSGVLVGFDIGEVTSTNDGWVNNTGGAFIFMTDVTIGAGAGNPMITSGGIELYNAAVQCPVNFGNGTSGTANGGTWFKNPISYTGNAQVDIQNSYVDGGASSAITFNSSSDIKISSSVLKSSINPCVAGSGAGNITFSGVDFEDNANIAPTLTIDGGKTVAGSIRLIDRTPNAVAAYATGGELYEVGPLTDGQLVIGDTGAFPKAANLTSTGGTISITNGSGTINLEAGAGVSTTFTTDSGNATPAANVLNIFGGNSATTSGAGNTVTVKNLADITKYVVDPVAGETGYQTIQSALDAANAAGVDAEIYVKPGTYTENLTLYGGQVIRGATLETMISGNHTPPASGFCTLKDLYLTAAAGDILSSAAAGTTIILIENCYNTVTNGYICDLPNWAGGTIAIVNCTDASTNNGVINCTGGANALITNSFAGRGTANTLTFSNGNLDIISSRMGCPVSVAGTGTTIINEGSSLLGTLTTGGSVTTSITQTKISTGATQAITHGSTGTTTLGDVSINSSNNPCIGGAGAGNLVIGSITYLNDTDIAGTITKSFTTRFETGELKLDDSDNGILVATNGVVSTGGGTLDQEQIYYVGKHGNDANDGLSIGNAVLTFGQALTLATAATPGAANRFAIVCFDDGIYTENITCVQYVDINAPNAKLVGAIMGVDDTHVKFREQDVATGTVGINKTTGTGYFFCEIENQNLAGNAIGLLTTSGFTNFIWKRMFVVNGVGIGDLSTAISHLHVKGGDIYISGTGVGIGRANAGSIVGRIDHILDTGVGSGTGVACIAGTIDLQISRIDSVATGITSTGGITNIQINELSGTAAYNVGAAAELNLIVNEMTGTETNAGTLSLIRGDGTSRMNNIISTSLTDTSRTQHAVSIYGASGVLSEVGPLTDVQLVIGSTGVAPVAATLTAGTGVSITNAAGAITINSTGGGVTWTNISANQALAVNNGVNCTGGAALSLSLPATSAVGDIIEIALDGSTSWTITQAANQQIRLGSSQSTLGAGGSIASTAQGDWVRLVCKTANLLWTTIGVIGNITVT